MSKAVVGHASIESFVALVQQGIDAWTKAGALLVEMLNSDPQLFAKIRAKYPDISLDTLTIFERIGRGMIYAPLLASGSAGARKLLGMPFEVQKQCHGAAIPVVTLTAGKFAVERKRVDELSAKEAKRIFDFDCVLTEDQQKKRIMSEIEDRKPMPVVVPPVREKPSLIGFFAVSIDHSGNPTIKPCLDNGRAYYAKLSQGKKETVIQLFR